MSSQRSSQKSSHKSSPPPSRMPSQTTNPRLGQRVVLLGESGVGKSSVAYRVVHGNFIENSSATIGAAYLSKTVYLQDDTVRLDIWDTAGQDKYAALAPMYYRTASAAVVVYDVTDKRSLGRAMEWLNELRLKGPPNIVTVLCGNKIDMADRREIKAEDASEIAAEKGLLFMEASAKTGVGVEEIFTTLAKKLSAQPKRQPDKDTVVLGDNKSRRKKKCVCPS